MSSTTFYGGSNRLQTSINNLWGAVNSLSTGGTGTGNMTYSGTGSIGSHYVQGSLDGKTAINSKLIEDSTSFNFGSNDLVAVNNIDCTVMNIGTTEYKNQSITDPIEINLNAPFIKSNAPSVLFSNSNITAQSFIKIGGTGLQYLMADGSTLESSGGNANSNIYLYNNISNVITPPLDIGDIGYNNINQENASIIYISHLTRDGLDIERYYNDLTDLNYVYIQDQTTSTNFIKYTITGTPTIITESYISIPVEVEDKGGTGATSFGNNRDIMLSFFTNSIEVDSRLSALENKTQHQTAPSVDTVFLTNVDINNNELNNVSKMTTINGTLNIGYANNDNYSSTDANIVCGNGNTINDNEQIIFGNYNSILSNQTVVIGASNINIKTGLGNVIGHGNSVSATIANVMGYNNVIGGTTDGYFTQCIGSNNVCDGLYASAIGSNITNNTEHSLCLGDSEISTIYANSLVCNLGNATKPFKDIYYSGKLISDINPILNITNTATLFYNNITMASSNSSYIPSTCLINVGGAISQVSQVNNTTAKAKLFKTLLQPTSTAAYQDAGLISNTTFLLNNQRLYIGMGFNMKISFGVADGGSAVAISTAGMFIGLIGATGIAWSSALLPTTLVNCIGIGHDPSGSNIQFIFRGSLTTGITIATQFNTSTPDDRWFHLSITNQFNSNNVVVSLTEAISNITESHVFVCGTGTSSLATSVQLYPCIQRMMGGGGGVSQSAQVHFGQLTFNQLI